MQLERAVDTGIMITNLSTHEHIHMIPELLAIVIRLAQEFKIRAIRYPHKDRSYRGASIKTFYKAAVLSYLEKGMARPLKASGLLSPEHFLGFLDSGNMAEDILIRIVDGLPEGTTELVCHPGFLGREVVKKYTFHMNSEAELFGLTSRRVKKIADEKCIGLISYAEFLAQHKAQ
jgi:chitin disaccharide deacetylase